jgi:hypothetical protein
MSSAEEIDVEVVLHSGVVHAEVDHRLEFFGDHDLSWIGHHHGRWGIEQGRIGDTLGRWIDRVAEADIDLDPYACVVDAKRVLCSERLSR